MKTRKADPVNSKDKPPNQRKMAFRQEAIIALLELDSETEVTFDKAMEVSKLDCRQCKLHDAPTNAKPQNCRDNPFCIQRMGVEKFEKLISQELQNRDAAKEDQKRRDLNDRPAGLTNSGNFCYVNSFLQVWFNELEFRQIVYDFRPSDSYVIPEHPRMNVQKVMLSLQDLFYTLQTTPFFDTDKNKHLISALRLNQEQQDAQEFALMLFDALDRNLLSHPNGLEIRDRIKQLYTGMTRSRTSCECGMTSEREEPCTSLSLNIAGHATLLDALDEYFSDEKLDDYRCSECSKVGRVAKRCEYVKLPPVIIVQLNRYTYTAKGRKKLKNELAYPREIPALAFQRHDQTNPPSSDTYDLFAVMIHEGDNADCGHYYDLVKAPLNQKWYQYDDEKVEAMTKLPGTEKPTSAKDIQTNGKKGKKTAKEKNKTSSDQKACYGLLYKRRDKVLPLAHPRLPPEELIALSKKETEDAFVGQTTKNLEKSEKRVYHVQRRYDKLRNNLAKLETYEGKFGNPNEIAFLPTDLLTDVLRQEYEEAKGTKKSEKEKEKEKKEAISTVEAVEEAKTSGEEEVADITDIVDESMEVDPVEERPNTPKGDDQNKMEVDLLALAMTSSELPTIEIPAENETVTVSGHRTRARNGVSRKVYGSSSRKTTPLISTTSKGPVSSRVAATLGSHELNVCVHGKMPIETILYGDVKAVSRAPAIALLREYEYMAKIVREDGAAEYPPPEKDREIFVFTAEDLCMECILELRREGKFTIELEEDDRMARKIFKEEKLRCSVKGPEDKPNDHYYVAKSALNSFKKSAISERHHRLKTARGHSDVIYVSVGNQKNDEGFQQPHLKRTRGRPRKRRSTFGGTEDENEELLSPKVKSCSIGSTRNEQTTMSILGNGGREPISSELPEKLLEDEEENSATNDAKTTEMETSEGEGRTTETKKDDRKGSEDNEERQRSSPSADDSTRPPSRGTPLAVHVEFNSDLRCTHGGVNFSQFRHCVSPEEWGRLSSYFGDSFAVRVSDEVCEACRQAEVDAHEDTENMRAMVREMRRRLNETLKKVEIRQERKRDEKTELKYAICSVFIDRLKKLTFRSTTEPPPICQSCVFCSHGKPCRGFADEESTSKDACLIRITEDEWSAFVREIGSIHEAQTVESGEKDADGVEVPVPVVINENGLIEDLCEPCYEEHLRQREEARYVYENEQVFVRLTSGSAEDDAAFAASKSTRRKKNFYGIRMSSTSRLLDLKVALYDKCHQTPMEQLLYRNLGGEIFDSNLNEKSLFELRVLPNNQDDPLVLIAHQTNGGSQSSTTDESSEPRVPERGFVDTALAH